LTLQPPLLLLADHPDGERPILVYWSGDEAGRLVVGVTRSSLAVVIAGRVGGA
jgi:hypothetical protein